VNRVEQAEAQFGVMFGNADPDAFVELRGPAVGGGRWASEFHRGGDIGFACADRIVDLGAEDDTYIGALPRTRRSGKADAIGVGSVVWVDADTPKAVAAVRAFPLPWTLIVRSGGKVGSEAKLHAYLGLTEPVEGSRIEAVNRQFVRHLGADERACDRARILRPAGTFNYKGRDRAPVEIAELDADRTYAIEEIEEVVGQSPAEPADPANVVPLDARRRRRAGGGEGDGFNLDDRPPVEYVEIVAGIKAQPGQKIACPFPDHEDHTPSLHLYGSAERGWYCYGCRRGGGVYEFAACFAGLPLPVRGADFLDIQSALLAAYEREFGVAS
jgi:hypothetical protein